MTFCNGVSGNFETKISSTCKNNTNRNYLMEIQWLALFSKPHWNIMVPSCCSIHESMKTLGCAIVKTIARANLKDDFKKRICC